MQPSLRAAASSETLNTSSPHNYQINSLISASSILYFHLSGWEEGEVFVSANPVPCSFAVNKYIYEGRAFTVLHLRSAVGFKQQIQIIEKQLKQTCCV